MKVRDAQRFHSKSYANRCGGIGCKRLCGAGTVVLNKQSTALNIAATWVFPLAIFLGLPWESYHDKKIRRTLGALLNWLGSPQTALTATVWNYRQTRQCRRRVAAAGMTQDKAWIDAHYGLSCLNQHSIDSDLGPPGDGLLETLTYALFRPLSEFNNANAMSRNLQEEEIDLTKELLSELTFHDSLFDQSHLSHATFLWCEGAKKRG